MLETPDEKLSSTVQLRLEMYRPADAMLLTFFNSWLVMILLGLLIFTVNLRFSRYSGILIAAAVVLWKLVVNQGWTWMVHLSPASWIDLSCIDGNGSNLYPSEQWVLMGAAILFIVLFWEAGRVMKHRDIDVLKYI